MFDELDDNLSEIGSEYDFATPQGTPHYIPSPEQIAQATERIREGWNERTRESRAGAACAQQYELYQQPKLNRRVFRDAIGGLE